MKYQYKISDKTVLTVYGRLIDLWNNTPDSNAPTRSDVMKFGDNYLLNNDPTSPNYFGYSYYHVQTDFVYIGLKTELDGGWKLDNKVNSYRYWNKQNLEKNLTTLSSTSGTDKLNGANHFGDVLTLSQVAQETSSDLASGTIGHALTATSIVFSIQLEWTSIALRHEHFITQTFQRTRV